MVSRLACVNWSDVEYIVTECKDMHIPHFRSILPKHFRMLISEFRTGFESDAHIASERQPRRERVDPQDAILSKTPPSLYHLSDK